MDSDSSNSSTSPHAGHEERSNDSDGELSPRPIMDPNVSEDENDPTVPVNSPDHEESDKEDSKSSTESNELVEQENPNIEDKPEESDNDQEIDQASALDNVQDSAQDNVQDDDQDKDQDNESKNASDSDDDDSEDEIKPIRRKMIEDSDDEEEDANKSDDNKDEDEESQSSDEEVVSKKRKRSHIKKSFADSDEDSDSDDSIVKRHKPSTSVRPKADKLKEAEQIFGDSESEDEEFEGFKKAGEDHKDDDSDEEDILPLKKKRKLNDSDSEDEDKKSDSDNELETAKPQSPEAAGDKEASAVLPDISSSSEEEEQVDSGPSRRQSDGFVYDFDIMMQKRKEQNARARKRKNTDIINDSDDIIAELIQQMKQAAEDDFELNKDGKAATRKMKLLPVVLTQLRKIDLREAFLDAGVLSVITDWLTPLPDRSLPNLQVRETMLKLLIEFNIMDVERLKASGIGKAVMYLFKHPKEIKDNKKRAGQLISNWARPIFNCETDYHSISKEDREQRDFDHMNKVSKRVRVEEPSRRDEHTPSGSLRPGDKGWVPRARVPAPSTRDYVVRPKSTVEIETSRSGSKKQISRLERHLRNFQEKKRAMKTQRAVKISIEGRKL